MHMPLVAVSRRSNKLNLNFFAPIKEMKNARSLWGLQRTLVNNLIIGVTNGFSKQLEINEVGYRAHKGVRIGLKSWF